MPAQDSARRDDPPTNPYQPPKASFEPIKVRPGGPLHLRRQAARRPPPGAQFSLSCPCGMAVTVAASEAGSTVQCDCGAPVQVPSLGRLREMVGMARYESGPDDTIRRMIQTGELPAGRTCAVSGESTDDLFEFEILVPRSFTSGKDWAQRVLDFWLFGSFIGYWVKAIRPVRIEEADALRVRAPLRVCGRYHAKVRGMSQRQMKKLLSTVAPYAELFEKNPLVQILVGSGS